MYLNYVEYLVILSSTVTGCVASSAFASWVSASVGITSYGARKKLCNHCSNYK